MVRFARVHLLALTIRRRYRNVKPLRTRRLAYRRRRQGGLRGAIQPGGRRPRAVERCEANPVQMGSRAAGEL